MTSSRGTVVLVESNLTGADAIAALKREGFRVILLVADLERLLSVLPVSAAECLALADRIISTGPNNEPEVLQRGLQYIQQTEEVSVLYSFAQPRIGVTASVARMAGLPGPHPDAVAIACDKLRFRRFLNNSAFKVRFAEIRSLESLGDIVRQFGFPCVLKPRFGHSSVGVRIFKSDGDLDYFVAPGLGSNAGGIADSFLLEEYFEGPLVSVESVTLAAGVHRIWGVSNRLLGMNGIELGAAFPLDGTLSSDAVSITKQVLDEIGFDLGPSHTEVVLSGDGARVVEVNPRPGGGGISRLIHGALGVDVGVETIKVLLGQGSTEAISPKRVVAMRSIFGVRPGTVRMLPTRSEILSVPGILDVWFQVKLGDKYEKNESNFGQILTIMAEGSNLMEAEYNCEKAAKVATSKLVIDH
jgi:biotin carboxylase